MFRARLIHQDGPVLIANCPASSDSSSVGARASAIIASMIMPMSGARARNQTTLLMRVAGNAGGVEEVAR